MLLCLLWFRFHHSHHFQWPLPWQRADGLHKAKPVGPCGDRWMAWAFALLFFSEIWQGLFLHNILTERLLPPSPFLCPSSLSLILLKERISPSLSQSHSLPPPPPPFSSSLPAFSHLGRLSVSWKPGGHCVAGATVSGGSKLQRAAWVWWCHICQPVGLWGRYVTDL